MFIKKLSSVIFGVVLFAGALFSAPLTSFAQTNSEVIHAFNSKIEIQKDGGFIVTESIVYDFGDAERHGIYRDIPTTAAEGPAPIIAVRSVTNETGAAYSYSVSTSNSNVHIKIGSANELITGQHVYIISYAVHNAMRTFTDHDELYWNVTGNGWIVPIDKATVDVVMPTGIVQNSNLKVACYTGAAGSTKMDCLQNSSSNGAFAATNLLAPSEGLTIVVGIPRGIITNTFITPTYYSSASDGINSGHFFIIPLLMFGCFWFFVLYKILRKASGKTPKPKPVIPSELKGRPVVVEYNPPDGLPPIVIGTILDRTVDITDISSVIMDLAVRGYLKIKYTVKEIPFWPDKKDFELVKLKDGTDLVHAADQIIFELLFTNRDTITLSELQNQKTKFQSDIKKIKSETEKYLFDEKYFDEAKKDKSKKWIGYFIFVCAIAVLFSNFVSAAMWLFVFVIFFATVIITTCAPALLNGFKQGLTPKGITTLAKILGFTEFLALTEKDKLRLLNAPDLKPETFEKFLPYAMVLGVEEQWAKKFEGIYQNMPKWYEDPTSTSFNSFVLMHSLSGFNNSFNSVFAITSPRSSSGFSGGSSGGGFGGGGGGSW